ncbi:hypothetical protein [Francisella philomiragia]|uniref:Uncharacterized protein n=1 Tax=Francisella philomiragia TaxID=28110 RepID=A0A0B6CUW7_9GAMM|nr:hypothetical protein [Francisella philomiragia]AJI52650.1 hypothetical protein LA55_1257 [Francisella philomiragia]
MKLFKDIICESFKLNLHITQKPHNKSFSVFASGKISSRERISIEWATNNKDKFKKRFHAAIDQMAQGLHPIYEPKLCEIDYEHQEVVCLNYKAEKIKLKLTKYNATKLGLSPDLVF